MDRCARERVNERIDEPAAAALSARELATRARGSWRDAREDAFDRVASARRRVRAKTRGADAAM
jgi:hypothetical protein